MVPLLPAYVSYIGGAGLPEIQSNPAAFQRRMVRGGLLYVVGFGSVFIALGVLAGFIGGGLKAQEALLQRIGGVLVMVMGLALLGALPGSLAERGFNPLRRLAVPAAASTTGAQVTPASPTLAPLLLGLVFGTAWTPCVGPVLAAILVRAAQRQEAFAGGLLLTAYTIGLGLPFIVSSLVVASVPGLVRPLARFSVALSRGAGALLVVLGLLLVTGLYQSLAGYLAQPFTLR